MTKTRVAGVATLLILVPALMAASPLTTDGGPPALKAITISFKLDPRLSGATYGGERWVSPPRFASARQEGSVGTVDVRVAGVDAKGRAIKLVPEWTAGDPSLVTVAASERGEFRITVKGAGESALSVTASGISKALMVRGKTVGSAIQVEIDQQPEAAGGPAPGADPRAPEPATPSDSDAAPAAPPAAPPSPLQDQRARNSYVLGFEMASRLKAESSALDAEAVARGVKDALGGGEPLLSAADRKAALVAVQTDIQRRRFQAQRHLAVRNKEDGEKFLAENKTRDGVVTLPSGLQYRVLRPAEGPKPTLDDTVICRYRGTFVDGTEFDSSHRRQRPAAFALKRVIPGWREALQMMPVGAKWEIVVPASLGYGAKGARGLIGPNATLVYDVELLSIKGQSTASTTQEQAAPASVASER